MGKGRGKAGKSAQQKTKVVVVVRGRKPLEPAAERPVEADPVASWLGQRKSRSVLTPALARQIADEVRAGLSFKGACDYVGVHYTNLSRWVARGEAFVDALQAGGEVPEEDAVYGYFVDLLRRTGAEYLREFNLSLREGGDPQWYRNMVVLERRDPDTWGKDKAAEQDAAPDPDERYA